MFSVLEKHQQLYNNYLHDKYTIWELESKSILQHSSFYVQLKLHAQFSWAWTMFYFESENELVL